MANQVTRTYVASIRDHQQVRNDLIRSGSPSSEIKDF